MRVRRIRRYRRMPLAKKILITLSVLMSAMSLGLVYHFIQRDRFARNLEANAPAEFRDQVKIIQAMAR